MLRLFLGHARRDIAYGVRGLARAPGFALVAILTLGVGLGATAGDVLGRLALQAALVAATGAAGGIVVSG